MSARDDDLCSRCGAVYRITDTMLERGEGECPECGLGFTIGTLLSRPSHPIRHWFRARRRPRARAGQMPSRSEARAVSFTVYGAEDRDWTSRAVVGSGRSNGRLTRLTLEFRGGAREDWIRVETDIGEWAYHTTALELVHHLWHLGEPYTDAMRSTFTGRDSTGKWDEVSIPVSGEPVTFRSLGRHERWVAITQLPEAVISIQALGCPPDMVALNPIDDLGRFVSGDSDEGT